jgi:hypothetical protein
MTPPRIFRNHVGIQGILPAYLPKYKNSVVFAPNYQPQHSHATQNFFLPVIILFAGARTAFAAPESHEFIAPKVTDQRSPCLGLNT